MKAKQTSKACDAVTVWVENDGYKYKVSIKSEYPRGEYTDERFVNICCELLRRISRLLIKE